jgi:hypothetical protein
VDGGLDGSRAPNDAHLTPDGLPIVLDGDRPDAFAFLGDATLDGQLITPDTGSDASVTGGCGYEEGSGFLCGGGAIPEALCTGDDCCEGICMPGGMNQVCCNRATGVITTCSYSAGTCPCTTMACD